MAAPVARPAAYRVPREIRLLAQTAPRRYGTFAGMGYVAQDDAEPARDSVDIPGPTLALRRNEPVRITVVNHLAEEISRLVTLSEAKGLVLGNDRARPFASLRVTHALAVARSTGSNAGDASPSEAIRTPSGRILAWHIPAFARHSRARPATSHRARSKSRWARRG